MMNGRTHARRAAGRRGGFTLVEMLVAVTIIGLLSAMVLAGLNSARETAKIDKTKHLITKLHYIIMAKYDSYRTRRVSMDLADYVNTTGYYSDFGDRWTARLARARVNAIRELMRREMPDRWSDVYDDSITLLPNRPALSERYLRVYQNAMTTAGGDTAKQKAVLQNAGAECLYMIVMNIPEAAEQFHASEIGDIDDDGLPEFHDAWGRVIEFVRWPVGFVNHENLEALNKGGSEPQGPAGVEDEPPLFWDSPSELQSGDRDTEPDPFDPRRVAGGFAVYSFAVYPLIYSAGPDGQYDTYQGYADSTNPSDAIQYRVVNGILDPYDPNELSPDSDGRKLCYVGQPRDESPTNKELNHYDNIHNHRLETGRGG